MKIGRFSSSVVAWGVLLVFFAFDKHCEAQSVPTPSPTNACLPVTQSAIIQCLEDSNLDVGACNDCYAAYLDLVDFGETTCGEANSIICNQIDACTSSCGTCGSFIEEYEACNYGSDCFLGCSPGNPTSPTSPVVPAPSPSAPSLPTTPSPPTSSTTECESEITAMEECVASTGGDNTACLACIGEFIPDTIESCEASEFYTCGAMEACSECGSCTSVYTALINCLNAGNCDPFVCTSPTPSTPSSPTSPVAPAPAPVAVSFPTSAPSPACIPVAQSALGQCFDDNNLDGQACVDCYNAYYDTLTNTTTCGEELTSIICNQIETCSSSCGTCGSYIEEFETCNWESDCFLTCPTSNPTTSPVAPTSAPSLQVMTSGPVASPTSSPVSAPGSSPIALTSGGGDDGNGGGDSTNAEDRCPSEFDTFQDCIATELSSPTAASCESCVSGALDGFTAIARQSVTCTAANDAVCPALENCGCGACAGELQIYLGCSVDALTTGCDLECGNPPVSTSGAGATGRPLLATLVGVAAGMVVTSWMGLV